MFRLHLPHRTPAALTALHIMITQTGMMADRAEHMRGVIKMVMWMAMTTATAGEKRIMTAMTDMAIATPDIMMLRITIRDTAGRTMNRMHRGIIMAEVIS